MTEHRDARPVDTIPEAMAEVTAKDDLCGYVDRNGDVVIPRRFEQAGVFSSGLAAVMHKGRVGFIDPKGSFVIAAAFTAAKTFREGVAPACHEGKGWGFIDRHGAWVIPPSFAFADSFSDGVAVVKAASPSEFHCIEAPWIGEASGQECEEESSSDDEEEPGPYFLIDRAGRRLNTKGYACITRMAEGRAAALWKGKWGYLDGSGREVIRPSFKRARPFGEGWAAVWLPNRRDVDDGDGKWGFIDKQGRFKVLARFDAETVGVFSQGLVAMEGLPVRVLLANAMGRACLERMGRTIDDLRRSAGETAECGVYLDKSAKIRVAVPNCGFADGGPAQGNLREFLGDYAELLMQDPMTVNPFRCSPALMSDVRLFVNRRGEFISQVVALASRAPEGLAPSCTRHGNAASLDLIGE